MSCKINPALHRSKKPEWIKVRLPSAPVFWSTKGLIDDLRLTTVCEEAQCPNRWECWSGGTATFMIAGDRCTRACGFCAVKTAKPFSLESDEPDRVAQATKRLGLNHVVITAVARDDLADGGAEHFKTVIVETRKENPKTTIEVLTPDFLKKGNAYKKVVDARPDVFNHNIETVPSLYVYVRPGSRYYASLKLLDSVKTTKPNIFTKSGLMVGLGEKKEEILQVMDDLRAAKVDFLTIGQYLQPSPKHYPLKRYYLPEEFKELKNIALSKGFLLVASSPLTRSSYHADEDFKKLKTKRIEQLKCQELQ